MSEFLLDFVSLRATEFDCEFVLWDKWVALFFFESGEDEIPHFAEMNLGNVLTLSNHSLSFLEEELSQVWLRILIWRRLEARVSILFNFVLIKKRR